MAENPIQFVWERPKAAQYGRTSHTKYMRTTPAAGGKKYGPIGHLWRHSTPWEVSGDACRVRWSGVAINATNRVHTVRVFPPLILDTWRRGRGLVHMALSDLSGHARPSHSACTSTQVMRPSVAHGAGLGAVLFPPAPGVVRMYFVWEVRPYWAAFGLSHTNCMGFSAIRFVWPNICIFPKVDRGWQNYFAP